MNCEKCQTSIGDCECDDPIVFGVPVRDVFRGLAIIGQNQSVPTAPSADVPTLKKGTLLNKPDTIAALFPEKSSQPESKTWESWRKQGLISWVKIKRKIYYDPAECYRSLVSHGKVN